MATDNIVSFAELDKVGISKKGEQNPKIEKDKYSDSNNFIPSSYKFGTLSQQDVALTPNLLNKYTVLECKSEAGTATKVGTYVDGLIMDGMAADCAGRTVLVKFTVDNTHDPSVEVDGVKTPLKFKYNNCEGEIKAFNDNIIPVYDSLKNDCYCLMTWTGTEWLLHPKTDFRKINQDIAKIESKIPKEATSENQLADKQYVDNSVATNSAHFLGTKNSLEEIKEIDKPTNNDYAYLDHGEEDDGTHRYTRYKYSEKPDEKGEHWLEEFTFESTNFNNEQKAAINSGVNKDFVDHINEITPDDASADNKLADESFVTTKIEAETTARITAIETLTQTVTDGLDTKVDKVNGKGLSTHDFTDELKADVEDNTSKAHTHSNKGILDSLGQDEDGSLKFGDTIVGKVRGVKGDAETEYRTGEVNITPENIGLGNVDNTSDVDKPVSTATQTKLNKKVDKENPVMTGSFSLNRKSGSNKGANSFAEGNNTTASGPYSHAEGLETVASGQISHTEGCRTVASNDCTHAEGYETTASNTAAHAEGYNTTASGAYSHAEGYDTIASGDKAHVQGKYNVEDTANKFADIIGNGSFQRHNASATDWDGNQYLAGDLYVRGTNRDATGGEKVATVTEVGTVQTAVDTLNGNDTVEGSVDYKITEALRGITTFDFKIVSELPEEGKKGIIYLVRTSSTDEEDKYNEYIWIETETERYYEMLGTKTVKVDLTDYQKVDGSNATADGVSTALKKLSSDNVDIVDQGTFIYNHATPGEMSKNLIRITLGKLWDWIKGKLSNGSFDIKIGSSGGKINGSASNGNIDSILIGDDVWLGDANIGGGLGVKSNNSDGAGIYFYNNAGGQTGSVVDGHASKDLPLSGGNLDRNVNIGVGNTQWEKSFYIVGNPNDYQSGNFASIGTTNGNCHIDSADNYGILLNYYRGNNGVHFGNGNNEVVASVDASGNGNFNQLQVTGNCLKNFAYIDLSAYSTDRFFPLVWGYDDALLEIELQSDNVGGGDPYNQNTLHVFVRTAGWSDTPPTYQILEYACYDYNERTILGLSRGQQSGSFGIWVRGGNHYRLKTTRFPVVVTETFYYGTEYWVGNNNEWGSGAAIELWCNLTSYGTHSSIFSTLINGTITNANNASALNGYGSDVSASGNSIVRRSDAGYIYGTHFNQGVGVQDDLSVSEIITGTGDGWYRRSSLQHVKDAIGSLPANGGTASSSAHLLINGVTWDSNWSWKGNDGQPSWLWGGNDGVNMSLWNPSNFSVNYANGAGNGYQAVDSSNGSAHYIKIGGRLIEYGWIQMTDPYAKHIDYPISMTDSPTVCVTIEHPNTSYKIVPHARNITGSGFYVDIDSYYPDCYLHWIAMGRE